MVVGSTLAHIGALGLVLATPGDTTHGASPGVISVELVAPFPAQPAQAAPCAGSGREAGAPEAASETEAGRPPREAQRAEAEERGATRAARAGGLRAEPEKKEEKNLDELLAEMRGDADAPPSPTGTEEPVETAVAPSPGTASGTGDPLSAEVRDWIRAPVIRKMKGDLGGSARVPHPDTGDLTSWSDSTPEETSSGTRGSHAAPATPGTTRASSAASTKASPLPHSSRGR